MPIIPANNIQVLDEGTSQGFVRSFNFTGSNVTASVSGSAATVNVTGGSGSVIAGTANFSFGTSPPYSESVTTTVSEPTITTSHRISLGIFIPSSRDGDEAEMEDFTAYVSNVVALTGFDITLTNGNTMGAEGTYSVRYVGSL